MTPLRALIHEPEGISEGTLAPLLLFLHGSGERGDDLARVKWWSPFPYLEAGHPLPAYVAAPQCALDLFWGDLLDELDRWLDDLLEQYPVDPDRVLLTGFSMGGFGAWQWALRCPERFAALMPIGGNGFHFRNYTMPADLCALKDLPIWMIHSAGDMVVPVSGADEFHQALRACGAVFGYTRYPDAGHVETATAAFADPAHYDWLLKQKRQGKA